MKKLEPRILSAEGAEVAQRTQRNGARIHPSIAQKKRVIPAKAGTQELFARRIIVPCVLCATSAPSALNFSILQFRNWVPAFAGMTRWDSENHLLDSIY
jgi:hypothetical protein